MPHSGTPGCCKMIAAQQKLSLSSSRACVQQRRARRAVVVAAAKPESTASGGSARSAASRGCPRGRALQQRPVYAAVPSCGPAPGKFQGVEEGQGVCRCAALQEPSWGQRAGALALAVALGAGTVAPLLPPAAYAGEASAGALAWPAVLKPDRVAIHAAQQRSGSVGWWLYLPGSARSAHHQSFPSPARRRGEPEPL